MKLEAGGQRHEARDKCETSASASRLVPRGSCLLFCFSAFLFSRFFDAFFVYLGHLSHPFLEKIPGGFAGVSNWWLNPWTTFDSRHFLSIAGKGYEPQTTAFFPLYPLILRLAGPDENRMAAWGILVSNAAFFGGLWAFYRLAELECDAKTARRGVWLLAFFPTAAYFSAVYTESLFLLCVVPAFWAARRQKWLFCAIFAALAALTRNSGPVLFLALLGEAFVQWRDKKPFWPTIFAAICPLLVFLAVQSYFNATFGFGAGVASQKTYFRAPGAPWTPILRDLGAISTGRALDMTTFLHLSATIVGLVFAVILWRQKRFSYAILTGGILLMHLTLGHTIPPYTLPSARYMMTTFPFIELLAVFAASLEANRLRLALFAALYLLAGATQSFLFGAKSFGG